MGIQRSDRQSSGIVPIAVRNTTGETIPAYAVVAIGYDKEFGVFQRDGDGVGAGRATVPVRKPDEELIQTGNTSLFLFVTDSPIPPGQVGYATSSIPTWAKVDDTLIRRGQEASPKKDSWQLEKGPGFWQVMDVKVIGSSQYAFVSQSTLATRIFRTPEEGIPGRTGDEMGEAECVAVQVRGKDLEDTDDEPELVRNFSTEEVEGDKRIIAHWIDSAWVTNCCFEETSSSSGSSEYSESSDSQSQSESSRSDSSQSDPSQSDSSQSDPSQSDPSQSDPPSEGSDKSTAIVPASWTPGGYTALFTLEAPEVRFDDVITVTMAGRVVAVPIDPKYVEVCHEGSITISGAVPDEPVIVGAKVINTQTAGSDGDDGKAVPHVLIKLGQVPFTPVTVSIRLTAIRKGFAGHRFPNRTREQFVHNERFIQSAYPGAGK